MKNITLFVGVAALLLGCSGLAAAQCAGQEQFAGFDLLQTTGGSQDNLQSVGLTGSNPDGSVTFTGVALPPVTKTGVAVQEVGTTDSIVCRFNPLPNPIPSTGVPVTIQMVALYLRGDATYQPNPQATPTAVTVYATINQTQDSHGNHAFCRDVSTDPRSPCFNPANVLPEPTPTSGAYPSPSSGQMTVFPQSGTHGTFDTNNLNIQADLIIVHQNDPVTATPIAVVPMPLDTLTSSGSTWTTSAPSGYPNSTTFPSGGFFVNDPNGTLGAVVPLITSRIFRGSLYGLSLVLLGIAVLKIRSGINGGRLTLRPVYLMGLAAITWFLGWKSSKLVFPTVAHAAGVMTTCVPHTISAFINEGNGQFFVHKIVTAVCHTTSGSF